MVKWRYSSLHTNPRTSWGERPVTRKNVCKLWNRKVLFPG